MLWLAAMLIVALVVVFLMSLGRVGQQADAAIERRQQPRLPSEETAELDRYHQMRRQELAEAVGKQPVQR